MSRYDIYPQQQHLENGKRVTTWHIMDTANRCADMGYTFGTRNEALRKCRQIERRAFA